MERGVGKKRGDYEAESGRVAAVARCLLSWMLLVHQPRHWSLPLQMLAGKWCDREHFDKAEVTVVFGVLLCVKYALSLSFNQAPVAQKPWYVTLTASSSKWHQSFGPLFVKHFSFLCYLFVSGHLSSCVGGIPSLLCALLLKRLLISVISNPSRLIISALLKAGAQQINLFQACGSTVSSVCLCVLCRVFIQRPLPLTLLILKKSYFNVSDIIV